MFTVETVAKIPSYLFQYFHLLFLLWITFYALIYVNTSPYSHTSYMILQLFDKLFTYTDIF